MTLALYAHPFSSYSQKALVALYANHTAFEYRSLEEAARVGAKIVAFPAISTGVYGYPKDKAALVAVTTVKKFLDQHPEMDQVRFVCFSADSAELHQQALDRLSGQ